MAGMTIRAERVSMRPDSGREIEVELEDVDIGSVAEAVDSDDDLRRDVLDEIGVDRAVQHFGNTSLLDEIGSDAAAEHFGLVKPA